ncbi:MAG: EAL domain-containing protein [Spirochaetes bacterium]|jgi:EAL domain-containing protein (putative c-di-GMP-specific phosphodiesterase class I)|nr:EAL domain-containing protein [Spirochaetota bacterium]
MPRGSILIVRAASPKSDQLGALLRGHDFSITELSFGEFRETASTGKSFDLIIYYLDDSIAANCAPEDLLGRNDAPSLAIAPAAADFEYLLNCVRCGMGHFLTFPYGKRSLASRIEDIIHAERTPDPTDDERLRLLLRHGGEAESIELGKKQVVDFIVSSLENSIHRSRLLRKIHGGRRLAAETENRTESAQTLSARAREKIQLEQEILRAIERDEFEMFYQPIVDMAAGGIVGFESLIRWRHPDRGYVPPAEFIPFAEESALILSLGFIAIEKTSRQLRQWHDTFADADLLSVSINLSTVQFIHPELAEEITEIVDETGVPHEYIRFEITESTIMADMDSANMMLLKLKSMNYKLYMDDFGTGYSSLSYLRHFPMDVIKIDQSFIKFMGVDEESLVITKTIIDLAHNLGKLVVAEGIETEEHLVMLREMGCDYGQGYLFSPPLCADDTRKLLKKRPHW